MASSKALFNFSAIPPPSLIKIHHPPVQNIKPEHKRRWKEFITKGPSGSTYSGISFPYHLTLHLPGSEPGIESGPPPFFNRL
jgi:hypothetical protein